MFHCIAYLCIIYTSEQCNGRKWANPLLCTYLWRTALHSWIVHYLSMDSTPAGPSQNTATEQHLQFHKYTLNKSSDCKPPGEPFPNEDPDRTCHCWAVKTPPHKLSILYKSLTYPWWCSSSCRSFKPWCKLSPSHACQSLLHSPSPQWNGKRR